MNLIKLSFFASLQQIFGEEIEISIKEPIRLIQIFDLFYTKSKKSGSEFFLINNCLRSEYIILLNGRNINCFEGLSTIVSESCNLSFFPLIGGGYQFKNL